MARGPVPPGQGSYQGDISRQIVGVALLPLLASIQKDRRFSSDSQSQGIECLSPHGEIQNGDPGFNSMRSAAGHVNDLIRPEGRFRTHPNLSSRQEVYEVRVEGLRSDPLHLPAGSFAVQFGNSPQGIYQAFGPHSSPLAPQEYVYVPAHRHLQRSDLQGLDHSDSRCQCLSLSPAKIYRQSS